MPRWCFFEEILFRGGGFDPDAAKMGIDAARGVYLAVLVSSSIFGILHLVNLIMGRRDLLPLLDRLDRLPKSFMGLFSGSVFAACFLRNKTIWPVIFSHALFDLCGNFNAIAVGGVFGQVKETTPQEAVVAGLVTLPLIAVWSLSITQNETRSGRS